MPGRARPPVAGLVNTHRCQLAEHCNVGWEHALHMQSACSGLDAVLCRLLCYSRQAQPLLHLQHVAGQFHLLLAPEEQRHHNCRTGQQQPAGKGEGEQGPAQHRPQNLQCTQVGMGLAAGRSTAAPASRASRRRSAR